MLEEILDTKVKIRIAKLFSEINDPMTVSEISRKLDISKSRTSVCLRELNEDGILQMKHVGRSILYSLSKTKFAESVVSAMNQDKNLIIQIEKDATRMLKKCSPVSIAMFGSALKGFSPGKDVDILMIHQGKINQKKVYEIESELIVKYGIQISILIMSLRDFIEKSKQGEEFVINVLANHKLIFGKKLEELPWQRK